MWAMRAFIAARTRCPQAKAVCCWQAMHHGLSGEYIAPLSNKVLASCNDSSSFANVLAWVEE